VGIVEHMNVVDAFRGEAPGTEGAPHLHGPVARGDLGTGPADHGKTGLGDRLPREGEVSAPKLHSRVERRLAESRCRAGG
jgi:hypothetical protein